ncbi:ABC transporter ATP-binding protein [Paenibacillus sp. Soil750]|uniref:ABC transporter ATP-binding protein n=1 Tax=Paenibacillus sp. Soil750 TaxID=1736398 RepID=UPI0006F60544|nr:ABC transporter ATP-binding protein [Paenibacillus sp. Soil750]KRE75407.1 ABC transporter [Paenibacillus sp. Soil750]
MSELAIQVTDISKVYKLYDKPMDRLLESLNLFNKKYHRDFHAVNNVSFEVRKGETLGIIGKNGSGKSTLLKMITGVLNPSSGNIMVNGKISALLELGAGFNPELTGLENIYMNGTIMGYTKAEMDQKLDGILSFADIGEFINQPVKIYSSGMFVRLAFSVAINVDPEILIIDEALSVGDMRFQQKCFRKIDEFRDSKTILFVSHDLSVINKYCNRAIWINEGVVLDDGIPKELSKRYQAFMIGSNLSKTTTVNDETQKQLNDKINLIDDIHESLDVLGDDDARISGISLFDVKSDQKISIVEPGQAVKMYIKIKSNTNIENPIIGFSLKDRLGNVVTQSNSFVLEKVVPEMKQDTYYGFCFEFEFPPLNIGQYSISPAIASGSQEVHTQHSWVHDAIIIQVLPVQKYQLSGFFVMDNVKFYSLE